MDNSSMKAQLLATQPQSAFQLFASAFRLFTGTFHIVWVLAIFVGLASLFEGVAETYLLHGGFNEAMLPIQNSHAWGLTHLSTLQVILTLLALIAAGLLYVYFSSVMMRCIYAKGLNLEVNIKKSRAAVWKKYGWILLTNAIVLLILMLSLAMILIAETPKDASLSSILISLPLLLTIPILITLYVYLSMADPIVVLTETKNPFQIIKKSFQMLTKNWWRIALVYLMAFILLGVVYVVVELIIDILFDSGMIRLIAQGAVEIVTSVYIVSVIVAVFNDLSLRQSTEEASREHD